MIYTKGKAGYHMEKSDILTASLPDANYETTDHSTIFDDVFRTIAQKMPQLLIPLINEVFHTSYSEEEHFEQLRNEHYEKIWHCDYRFYYPDWQSHLSSGMPVLERQNDGYTNVRV